MALTLTRLPVYGLAGVALLGAFSRFTHGRYTPSWYVFQEYHAPDDGSAVAKITPIMDTIIGITLLSAGRRGRLVASLLSVVFFTTGTLVQVNANKAYTNDILLLVLGVTAVAGSFMSR